MNRRTALGSVATVLNWRTGALFALLLACLFVVPGRAQSNSNGESAVPENLAPHAAPAQPLPFSHKTHMLLELECQTCHSNPDPGSLMTFPATELCMSCHVAVATDQPAIVSLRAFAESAQKIPWTRVYALTPGVTWSHRAHLDSGTQCKTCHGDISQAEAVSETKAILAMATCISCHQARGAVVECVTCHAWPTDQLLGIE
ncbi:MAG: cytochrome c3 family protein [Proteobacteria bacterium]|nr:cytochrome c3 family protein [Pseudomonadota bacterium]